MFNFFTWTVLVLVPTEVQNLRITAQNSTSLLVQWSPPAQINGILLGYNVRSALTYVYYILNRPTPIWHGVRRFPAFVFVSCLPEPCSAGWVVHTHQPGYIHEKLKRIFALWKRSYYSPVLGLLSLINKSVRRYGFLPRKGLTPCGSKTQSSFFFLLKERHSKVLLRLSQKSVWNYWQSQLKAEGENLVRTENCKKKLNSDADDCN